MAARGREATGGGRAPEDVRSGIRPGRGRGGGAGAPARSAIGRAGRAADVVVFPPTVQRPPSAKDFNPLDFVSGLDAGGSPVRPAGLQVEIPSANVAVIRSLTLNINDMVPTTDVVWRLLFDGSPVQGWSPVTIFPRNAASVAVSWTPEETFIPVPEGADIAVELEVRDTGSYDVGASYHGWWYPQVVASRYEGAWG